MNEHDLGSLHPGQHGIGGAQHGKLNQKQQPRPRPDGLSRPSVTALEPPLVPGERGVWLVGDTSSSTALTKIASTSVRSGQEAVPR